MRALALVLLAAPAAAQEFVPDPYVELLAECYRAADTTVSREACIGGPSATCMDEEPQGQTTYGMARCAGIESDAWDVLMQGEFRATIAWARTADAEDLPEFRQRVDALRAAQAAWEAYMVEACRAEYALWGSGSMRLVAGARCRMQMTAERAIDLHALREGG